MAERTKPKVGDILYLVSVDRDYSDYKKRYELLQYVYSSKPVFVVKVGRKYFYYADELSETKDWRIGECTFESYLGYRSRLFRDYNDYFCQFERDRLLEKIRRAFGGHGVDPYNYDQIKAIADIIGAQ